MLLFLRSYDTNTSIYGYNDGIYVCVYITVLGLETYYVKSRNKIEL